MAGTLKTLMSLAMVALMVTTCMGVSYEGIKQTKGENGNGSGGAGGSGSGGTTPTCMGLGMAIRQMMPCMPSVFVGSQVAPTDACCSAIKSAGGECLCQILAGPHLRNVDYTRALRLPSLCRLTFPSCGEAASHMKRGAAGHTQHGDGFSRDANIKGLNNSP